MWVAANSLQASDATGAATSSLQLAVINGLQTPITGDIIRFKRLEICARSVGGDVIMGEGSVSLREVGVMYGKLVVATVKMKDKRGKPKGRVEVAMRIDPVAPVAAATENVR